MFYLVLTLCFATSTISCSSKHTIPHNQDEYDLSSIHDTFSHFVMADAEKDYSALAFYSCYTDSNETEKLKNPAAHPNNCVNAFKTEDGQPLTISKQYLFSKDILEFSTKNREKIKKLNQEHLNDINFHANNGSQAVVLGGVAIINSLVALGLSIALKKPLIKTFSSLALAPAILAYGYGMTKAYHSAQSQKTHPLDNNIDFKRLAKDSNQANSDEYKYFQHIIKSLGSISSEYQSEISINETFYKNFARFLQNLNLLKNKKIALYCHIYPKKKCNPI